MYRVQYQYRQKLFRGVKEGAKEELHGVPIVEGDKKGFIEGEYRHLFSISFLYGWGPG
jgi:hypothetical protein